MNSRTEVCALCQDSSHTAQSCPSLPTYQEALSEQANALHSYGKSSDSPFARTYNPNWRNHPNFSWRQNQPSMNQSGTQVNMHNQHIHHPNPTYPLNVPQQRKPSLEDTLQQFMQSTQQVLHSNSQAISKLETQLGQLATAVGEREKGKFPSQPISNPKGQYQVGSSNPNEEVKSITTLRSGKIIVKPDHLLEFEKESHKSQPENSKSNDSTKNDNQPLPYVPKAPFPQRLVPKEKGTQYSDILEVFKQAFLTEQVSSIIQHKTPAKYKDPGCPTISCVIGNHVINRALLDLGASVNLLPYSVYEQLGLGELKPTSMTLQLADRSIKIPRATSNAIINCRNGVLKLSFGNMTVELNVFNVVHKGVEIDDLCDVNMIETATHDFFLQMNGNYPFEKCLAQFSMNIDLDSSISEVNSLLESTPLMDTEKWKAKIEPFLPIESTIHFLSHHSWTLSHYLRP
ncbi:hypothetical protein UlMin_020355 [Ulmus minor]